GHHAVLFNEGVRDGKLRFSEAREVPVEPAGAVDAGVLDLACTNVNVLDLDGDATADLVHMPRAKRTTVFTPKQTSGTESGWSFQGRSIETADQQDFR